MTVTNIEDLKLDEKNKIGYTYKTLGAGFWALRQKNFRDAIEAVTREVHYHSGGTYRGYLNDEWTILKL